MAVSFKNENSFHFLPHLTILLIFWATYSSQICYHGHKERSISNVWTSEFYQYIVKKSDYCFSCLGAAMKKPEGADPPPVRSGLTLFGLEGSGGKMTPWEFLYISENVQPILNKLSAFKTII